MKFIDRTGETNKNNIGNLMKIIKYRNATDIDVLFLDTGFVALNRAYKEFSKGILKDLYDKNIYEIGYQGEGEYKGGRTKKYRTWYSMFFRCYDNKFHIKQPTYVECTVCEEWHNFQVFAKWYDNNYYEIPNEVMHLDKDILFKGNKIYSPENCIFVPQKINNLFTRRNASRGDLPIGVGIYEHDKTKYRAKCNNEKKLIYLGIHNNILDAFNAYKKYKGELIIEIAKEYKDKIPKELYDAMYKYKIEITD